MKLTSIKKYKNCKQLQRVFQNMFVSLMMWVLHTALKSSISKLLNGIKNALRKHQNMQLHTIMWEWGQKCWDNMNRLYHGIWRLANWILNIKLLIRMRLISSINSNTTMIGSLQKWINMQNWILSCSITTLVWLTMTRIKFKNQYNGIKGLKNWIPAISN